MIRGVNGVIRKLKKLEDSTKNVDLFTAGEIVRGDAVRSIQEVTNGRRYGDHVAGKKGEAPNTDTGVLVGTSKTIVESNTAKVVFPAEYAAPLEFGDHPFLVPAMKRNKDKVLEEAAQSITRDLRKIK